MISVIPVGEGERWDSIVKSFQDYDVQYLNSYARACSLHGEGEPLLFYFEHDTTRAINVVMKRDIAEDSFFRDKLPANTWFDISTPYGYGGFLTEGDGCAAVEKEYIDYCRKAGYVSEFVRFHLLGSYRHFFQGEVVTSSHNIIRTLDMPMEEMLMDFEHKVRKNIKRANAENLTVIMDQGEHLKEFLDIYYQTLDRNQAKDGFYYQEDFFRELHRLTDHYIYFHVLKDDKIISSELVLYGPKNCYSFLGGTNRNYYETRPNDFLKYHIILWAKKRGLLRFILGGGYGADDGIFRYKKSFAPKGSCDFYIGRRIFDKAAYKNLLDMKVAAGLCPDQAFFPEYRQQCKGG